MIGRDGTALHQMRVALRRLRAAMSLFSAVVSDERSEAIKTELRWLAQELGPARDLDTLILEVIKPMRSRHKNEPGLASIGQMFTRRRLKCYQRAQAAVQSARFRSLVLDSVEWVEAGPWSASEDALKRARRELPIEVFAAGQLSHRCKGIRRRGRRDRPAGSGVTVQAAHPGQKGPLRNRLLFRRVSGQEDRQAKQEDQVVLDAAAEQSGQAQ